MRRKNLYIHQQSQWPSFYWDSEMLSTLLAQVRYNQGRLLGRMENLGFDLRTEATLHTLTLDVLKSSEIEGEILNSDQVRSSIARRLGIEMAGLVPSDKQVDGVVEMMLDATQKYTDDLTEDRIFNWHAALFPTGRSGMYKIVVADWRNNTQDDPMQVVSGAMGKEKIHFQAPNAEIVPQEMSRFLKWFNTGNNLDPVIKAAIAHLWFVTIHPLEDGNGRIARALTDMQLARADESPNRFYSMSSQIRIERSAYYAILEKTQKGTVDITEWLEWFLHCLDRSLAATSKTLGTVMQKAKLWEHPEATSLNQRQKLMLNKLLDGFDGKLHSSKWAKMAKCSQDTAIRDIQDLITRGILVKEEGGGRSTSYSLKEVDS